jgi:hypothetical protein
MRIRGTEYACRARQLVSDSCTAWAVKARVAGNARHGGGAVLEDGAHVVIAGVAGAKLVKSISNIELRACTQSNTNGGFEESVGADAVSVADLDANVRKAAAKSV